MSEARNVHPWRKGCFTSINWELQQAKADLCDYGAVEARTEQTYCWLFFFIRGSAIMLAVVLSSAGAALFLDFQQEGGMILSMFHFFREGWSLWVEFCSFSCGRCKRYSLWRNTRQMRLIQYIMCNERQLKSVVAPICGVPLWHGCNYK